MNKPIIDIQHISKEYKIAGLSKGYLSLRERIQNIGRSTTKNEKFWALNDISLQVETGECLGIIGRNGAGKSTLLKILSKITPPTKGKIIMRGRVASLLEVGTGFHPELTGKENVFLNGSILGMSKKEIENKYDEIIEFSGVSHFLDTPLKHYSSGMQLRLAFAVAAHLNPEILLIDEVLAVGDAAFQKKCIGKMNEVAHSGKSVIFVSHDLNAVSKLCSRVAYLEKGKLKAIGKTTEIIEQYLNETNQEKVELKREGTGDIQLQELIFNHDKNNKIFSFLSPLEITMQCNSNKALNEIEFAVCFNDIKNQRITSVWTSFNGSSYNIEKGQFDVTFNIINLHLNPGKYYITTYINQGDLTIERIDDYCSIDVIQSDIHASLRTPTTDQGTYIESFKTTFKKH